MIYLIYPKRGLSYGIYITCTTVISSNLKIHSIHDIYLLLMSLLGRMFHRIVYFIGTCAIFMSHNDYTFMDLYLNQ